MKRIFLFMMLLIMGAPAMGASDLQPKLNAKVGSVEKPYSSSGAYKWWDTSKGDGSGTVMDNVTVTARQRGVNIEKPIDNLLIKNSTFIGQEPMPNDKYPAGIFAKQGTNLIVENTTIRGWTTIADGSYRQGDCFLGEWGFIGVTLRNVILKDCTDGGADTKARNVYMDNVTAENNKINYRLWYNVVTAGKVTSITPKEAHIQTNNRKDGDYGMGGGGLIADMVVIRSTNTKPILWLEPNSVIDFKNCNVNVPAGTRFMVFREGGKPSNVSVKLGANCTIDAQGFAVNTPEAPVGFNIGEILVDKSGNNSVTLSTASTIARINTQLKANGFNIVLKKNDVIKQVSGTYYDYAK